MKAHGTIRLAMLGMIEGNAHPYSWSAIINGYDREAMAAAVGLRYPVIPAYLNAQPAGTVGLPGAEVTHVWTDDPQEAPQVAAAAGIAHVVNRPEDVIGEVDAVIIATDDGDDHVRRALPFVEANIPVFVDKPLATNLLDLWRFARWQESGKVFLSSSGLRYAPEVAALKDRLGNLGELRWVSSTTAKSWARYGIHALEPVYSLLGPGIEAVSMVKSRSSVVATVTRADGVLLTIAVLPEAPGSAGLIHLYGTQGNISIKLTDTYTAFRHQMMAFIEMLRCGMPPFPFSQTEELMLTLIAGECSLEREGELVSLAELRGQLAKLSAETIDVLPG